MAELIEASFSNGAKIEAGFRIAPAAMKRELRKSHKSTAKVVQEWTRGAARSGSPQQRHMAGGIGTSSTSTQARLNIRNTAGAPGALGTFWGAKKYRQFPTWVGNSWKPATPGQGPYVINSTLAKHEVEIEEIFLQGQLDALARALPRF